MAVTYPLELPFEVRRDPERDAERRVFDALKAGLAGEFRVFYSVAWLTRKPLDGAWDGEADFVIVHPRYGILVIEVKGGLVSRDGETGKWWTQRRRPGGGGKSFEIKDPVAQARRSRFHLASTIGALPNWVGGKPKLGQLVAFPHCDPTLRDLGPDCPAATVLYAPDLLRIEERILQVYEFWAGDKGTCTPVDGVSMKAIINLLAPSVELRPAARVDALAIAGTESTIAQLTDHQQLVLRSLARNRRVAVGGGAGTGKTMLALAKAKHLASQGFRTLLTCYNRPLADHLKSAVGSQQLLHVADFHQICLSTIRSAGLQVPTGSGPEFWEKLIPEAFADALAIDPASQFDAIVVDEGQDFAGSWWIPIELAIGQSDGVLYVFFDDNQRLYTRQGSFPRNMVEYSLCENLRNTRQIHDVTTQFYSGTELVSAGPSGPEVEYLLASGAQERKEVVGKLLHSLVKVGSVRAADVAILTGRSLKTTTLPNRLGSYELSNSPAPGQPLFESVARFKGLESPVVVLVEMEDAVASSVDESLYVGLSRARSSLFVVGSGDVLEQVSQRSTANSSPAADSAYLRRLLGKD